MACSCVHPDYNPSSLSLMVTKGSFMPSHFLSDLDACAYRLAQIAQDAGCLLQDMRKAPLTPRMKDDDSPVTAADLASEAVILAALARDFPDIPVVSEENAPGQQVSASHQGQTRRFFLVDPLDGTKAYIAGGADFCVLIALIEDGIPVAGALHAPISGQTWWVGAHVYRAVTPSDSAQGSAKIQNATIQRVFAAQTDRTSCIAMTSAYHAQAESLALCTQLGVSDIRHENSALKFIRLALGEADFYPRPGRTMQWDVAVGDAILRALGGGILSLEGKPLPYGYGAEGWANPGFIAYRKKPEL